MSLFDIFDDDKDIPFLNLYAANYGIEHYFNKFVELKYLFLYYYTDESNHEGEYEEITVQCERIKNNIIKCNYASINNFVGGRSDFSFFLDLHNSYQFRIKTQLYYNSYPDFDWDNKNEEIKINYPPLIEKIKFLEKDNYSLQVIDITNDPNDDNYGEYYYSKMLKIF